MLLIHPGRGLKSIKEISVKSEIVSDDFAVYSSFKESGRFTDEIKLEFDNGKTLYVACSFLSMASPVFEAMLTGDFKEKTTGVVKMTGKSCEDMTMLLQCMHPGELRPINTSIVLKIAPLAEEYQIQDIVRRCKQLMTNLMSAMLDAGENSNVCEVDDKTQTDTLLIKYFLQILCLANQCNFDDLLQKCITYIGLF